MSLSSSPRTVGTDGPDFPRSTGPETKSRLRSLIYIHFLLAIVILAHLVTYHFSIATNFSIPRPHLWQYIWLISLFPSFCALLSFARHRIFLMKLFFHGTMIFGFGTILLTILVNLSDLLTYQRLKFNHRLNEIEPQTFLGLPLIVLWYMFLIIAVQIHAFSLYLANSLLTLWQEFQLNKQR